MSEPRFVHPRVHSDYSVVGGLTKTAPLAKKVAALGMPALAITDFTNLCGLMKFYGTRRGAETKPIVGADFSVQCDLLGDELTHLTVLAANNTGYQNLTLLISKAYQREYGAAGPIADHDWLTELNEGLILLSGGHMGSVGRSFSRGNSVLIGECAVFYEECFPDRYFLELIRTGGSDEESYLHAAVELAEAHGLPVAATNDMHFIGSSGFGTHEIRVAVHDGFTLNDPKRPRNYSPRRYMHSEEKVCELFIDIPEALANAAKIARHCNVAVRPGEYFLPQLLTGGTNTEDYLVKRIREGLEERLAFLFPDKEERLKRHPGYDKRLETELQVINRMGFPGYSLIVMGFIQWSKDNGVPVGPGRGSDAGLLVAYALKITDLSPLEFDLLFKRFLNPERASMPDFDVDFYIEKRDQVAEYIADMYGHDVVSQIITFGTMATKAVIRNIDRVLGHPYGFVDRVSKLVPPDPGMTLAKAFKAEPQLSEICEADEEVKALIDMARKLEGIIHNTGKHTGGVVIAPTKITNFAPLYYGEKGEHPVARFNESGVKHVGLVKFDFLNLRAPTIVNWALEMIGRRRVKNDEPPLDIAAIPLDSRKSFDMLQHSETTAVFRLESRGMKNLTKCLQPDCFEDMITLVALLRPGPLQSGIVDNFIDRKHGREEISYPNVQWQHENLKPVLGPTYSIILYQEQVMRITQALSGYTLGGAGMLRRAIGKKKPEEMARQRSVLVEDVEENGINAELAMEIFDLVERFAGHGFNKSHSTAYALVSYQTLWLRAHYPTEFMAAVMTADMDNAEKAVDLVGECWRMGLKILSLGTNSGLYHFRVSDSSEVVYGVDAIKGVGEGPIETIIEARNKGGCFRELFDLYAHTNTKKLNRRMLEKLITSGAFDCPEPHHTTPMNSLGNALRTADQHTRAEAVGQADIFGVLAEEPEQVGQSYASCQPWPKQVILDGERKTLDLYLTGHPINQYLKGVERYIGGVRLKDMYPTERGKVITAAGLVVTAQVMVTKRDSHIGIYTLDDRSRRPEMILFAGALDKYQQLLEKDCMLIVSEQVSFDDFSSRLKMTACEAVGIDETREKYIRGLAILLTDRQIDDQLLNRLRQSLEPHRSGTIPAHLYYQRADVRTRLRFGATWRVSPNDRLLNDLHDLVGSEQVELEFD